MANKRTLFLAAILSAALATDASAFCFEEAGAEYGINPQILRAIAKVESNFNPTAVNKNTNGTYDFGLMQINSIWASTIGKERWNSLGDACANVKTGAWILSTCMQKYGYSWKAIGCYHSQTPDKRDQYSRKVFTQLQRVKPLAQEAAYSPLKDRVEELLKERVDGWVDEAAQGKREEFSARGAAVPASKGAGREQAQPGAATRQVPLPGISGNPTSFGAGNGEVGVLQGQQPAPATGG